MPRVIRTNLHSRPDFNTIYWHVCWVRQQKILLKIDRSVLLQTPNQEMINKTVTCSLIPVYWKNKKITFGVVGIRIERVSRVEVKSQKHDRFGKFCKSKETTSCS